MFLLSLTALAADRVEGSETLGAGRTSVAHPWSNSVVSTNVAVLGVNPRYNFGLAGSYGGRGLHWNITAADSKTAEHVAFGLTYSGDRYNPPLQDHELPGWSVPGQILTNHKRNHDVGGGLAVGLLEHTLSFGIQGSVSFYDHERQGKGTAGNAGLGMAWRPDPALVVGLVGRNLLPLADPDQDRPLELLTGVWIGDDEVGNFALEGGVRPLQDGFLVIGAGGEAAMTQGARVRAGYRLEESVHGATFGLGAGDAAAGVDLGFFLPLRSLSKPADWTVQLSLRFEGPDIDRIRPD